MGFKTISVTVSDSATDGPALALAAALALREDAHLDVVCIGIDPVRYADLPSGGIALTESGQTEARAQAAALADWASAALPEDLVRSSVQTEIVSQVGLDMNVARLIRYSDLVVAAKPYGAGRSATSAAVLDAALFGTGAPVMIAPAGGARPPLPFSRILVAWNESDEALSALRKCLPLLKAADRVDVVLVDPPAHSAERSDPGGAASLYLARHGVTAEVSVLARALPRVADNLLRFAHENGADALVMGAYGHSRFREALLGGPTRDMLERLDLPVIMSH